MMISFDDDFSKLLSFPPFFERIHLPDSSSCLSILLVDENDLIPFCPFPGGTISL